MPLSRKQFLGVILAIPTAAFMGIPQPRRWARAHLVIGRAVNPHNQQEQDVIQWGWVVVGSTEMTKLGRLGATFHSPHIADRWCSKPHATWQSMHGEV